MTEKNYTWNHYKDYFRVGKLWHLKRLIPFQYKTQADKHTVQ